MARRRKPSILDTINNVTHEGHAATAAVKGQNAAASAGTITSAGTAVSQGQTATSAASGVSSAQAASQGKPPPAPLPIYASPTSPVTTTVNLRPLLASISDPAVRALAPYALKSGAKYEINPSVLLSVVGDATDYGRKGQGKGYAGIGTADEKPQQSIESAAKLLSELGFHTDPQGAIQQFGKKPGYAKAIAKNAAGYTELDQAARHIEHAPGDTRVNGVGIIRGREPHQRPSAIARAVGQAATAVAGQRNPQNTQPLADQRRSLDPAQPNGDPAQAGNHPIRLIKHLTKAVKHSAAGSVPDYVPSQYKALVAGASKQHGVPAGLLSALLQQESGFQAHIGSPAGAQGIAQFMPGTAAGMGVNPNNPASAIDGAAKLLKANKDQFGSWDLALAAYNAGGGAVSQYHGIPPFAETQNYVKTIMGNWDGSTGSAASVPKTLVDNASKVLGAAATKAILQGGKIVKAPKQGDKNGLLPGRYSGSKTLIQQIIGAKVHGDHEGTAHGEPVGVHDPQGDHARPDGYAQDINGSGASENEPPFTQVTMNKIVSNIRKMGGDIPDQTIGGPGWTGNVGGYTVYIEGGVTDHIHVGAHPSGEPGQVQPTGVPIKGTDLMVVKPVSGATSSTTVAGSTSGVAGTLTAATQAAAKAKKKGPRSSGYTGSAPLSNPLAERARAALTPASAQSPTTDPLRTAFRPKRRR
jgi:soluble lytic murein transglycosylase-like protein